MKTYEPMTVESLTGRLEQLPSDLPVELSADLFSYRGYYDHTCLEPGKSTAGELLAEVRAKLGTEMTGYKGGEFPIHKGCLVFVAPYSDTGPNLLAIEDDGSVVLCEEA